MNTQSEQKHGECISEEMIADYLGGEMAPVLKASCEVHLVTCDRCRENLVVFMKLLKPEVSPEEEAALQAALTQWNQRELRPVPAPSSGHTRWWGWAVPATAVAAVLLLAVLIGRRPEPPPTPTPTDIVRILLERDRPFESQMTAQPYLPIQRTRGAEGDPESSLLLEAMTAQSASAYEFGRFYLTRKDYANAVRYLETAAADPNAAAGVFNDLGVAYLELGGEADLDRAEEQLRLALSRDEAFGPAVFNLSVLYVRRGMPDRAEEQWKRYLQLDPDSGWAGEVLEKLSQKESGTP